MTLAMTGMNDMETLYQFAGDSVVMDIAGGIAVATLNRPQHHNALSRELRNNLALLLRDVERDDRVKVLIITGAGEKSFSAGADLKEFEVAPLQTHEMGIDSAVMQAFDALSKPVIAAVNGYAVTGGLEIVVNCDIPVASTNARFADTHARVGVLPGWGLSQYLQTLVGPVRARYMAFTGNYIDAQTAKDWGLVLEVVEPHELLPYCRKIAADIISCDQATMSDYRKVMRAGFKTTFNEGFQAETIIARAGLARFDAAAFGHTRKQVVSRGKDQA